MRNYIIHFFYSYFFPKLRIKYFQRIRKPVRGQVQHDYQRHRRLLPTHSLLQLQPAKYSKVKKQKTLQSNHKIFQSKNKKLFQILKLNLKKETLPVKSLKLKLLKVNSFKICHSPTVKNLSFFHANMFYIIFLSCINISLNSR